MFKTRMLIGLLAIPMVALVSACGGGDDDDSPDASTGGGAGSTAGQSTGSAGATGAGSTGSQSTGATTGATGPASTGGADASDDFDIEDCPQIEAFVDSAGVGSAFTGGGVPGEDFDPEDFQNLAENAPGEIRDDMQVVADGLEEFFTALEDLEVDFSNPASFASLSAEDLAELEEISARFDTPEFTAASDRVTAYFEEICS